MIAPRTEINRVHPGAYISGRTSPPPSRRRLCYSLAREMTNLGIPAFFGGRCYSSATLPVLSFGDSRSADRAPIRRVHRALVLLLSGEVALNYGPLVGPAADLTGYAITSQMSPPSDVSRATVGALPSPVRYGAEFTDIRAISGHGCYCLEVGDFLVDGINVPLIFRRSVTNGLISTLAKL